MKEGRSNGKCVESLMEVVKRGKNKGTGVNERKGREDESE